MDSGADKISSLIWDHAHIRALDVPATVAWLKLFFSASIAPSTQATKKRTDLLIGGGKLIITEVREGDGTNAAPVFPHLGLEHFALECTDIDVLAAELRSKGAEVARAPSTIYPGLRVCHFRGPQGIIVELLERNDRYR